MANHEIPKYYVFWNLKLRQNIMYSKYFAQIFSKIFHKILVSEEKKIFCKIKKLKFRFESSKSIAHEDFSKFIFQYFHVDH
jgi:hypothetical protein